MKDDEVYIVGAGCRGQHPGEVKVDANATVAHLYMLVQPLQGHLLALVNLVFCRTTALVFNATLRVCYPPNLDTTASVLQRSMVANMMALGRLSNSQRHGIDGSTSPCTGVHGIPQSSDGSLGVRFEGWHPSAVCHVSAVVTSLNGGSVEGDSFCSDGGSSVGVPDTDDSSISQQWGCSDLYRMTSNYQPNGIDGGTTPCTGTLGSSHSPFAAVSEDLKTSGLPNIAAVSEDLIRSHVLVLHAGATTQWSTPCTGTSL